MFHFFLSADESTGVNTLISLWSLQASWIKRVFSHPTAQQSLSIDPQTVPFFFLQSYSKLSAMWEACWRLWSIIGLSENTDRTINDKRRNLNIWGGMFWKLLCVNFNNLDLGNGNKLISTKGFYETSCAKFTDYLWALILLKKQCLLRKR